MALFFVLLLISSVVAEPRRIPKIYNAVITSSENLEPSRAYPIVQPVLRPAAVAYQVQVPYNLGPAELATYPHFQTQSITAYGNQPVIPSNQQLIGTVPNLNTQVVGNTQTNQPSETSPNLNQQVDTSHQANENPPNLNLQSVPNLNYQRINSGQNLFQQIGQPNLNPVPSSQDQLSYPANIGIDGNQVKIQPNVGPNTKVETNTYPINIEAAGFIKPDVNPQEYQYQPQNVAPFPKPQEYVQYQAQPGTMRQSGTPQYSNVQYPLQRSVGQEQTSGFYSASTYQTNIANQQVQTGQETVQLAANTPQPVQIEPMPKYHESILNNSHKNRNIPDVPPPPLPTARRRLPAERPPTN